MKQTEVTKAPWIVGRGTESGGQFVPQEEFEDAIRNIADSLGLVYEQDWKLDNRGQRAEFYPPEDCDLEELFSVLHENNNVFVVSRQTV